MTNSPLVGASARPLASACPAQTAACIIAAAHDLLGHLAAGRRIDASAIRTAMHSAFGASDASGAWDWKAAYEAVEVAQLLFMRRYGPAIHAKTADPFERLKLVERIARLAPTQTRRSEEMLAYQQFSTPLGLAWVAGFACRPNPFRRRKHPGGRFVSNCNFEQIRQFFVLSSSMYSYCRSMFVPNLQECCKC